MDKGKEMKRIPSKIPGVFVIENDVFPDQRGSFVKIFEHRVWGEEGLVTNFSESYYSISHKGVIRGMHFQSPPHEHTKAVYVPYGKITDVLLDIRLSSPTYGQYESFEVSAENHRIMYIPPGIAHGFESHADNTIVIYHQNSERNAESEGGVLFNSFGMKWEAESPILSERDQQFATLADFKSLFK
jgi:dTDP-4-dehydrorhamnose 3,5-epimerase